MPINEQVVAEPEESTAQNSGEPQTEAQSTVTLEDGVVVETVPEETVAPPPVPTIEPEVVDVGDNSLLNFGDSTVALGVVLLGALPVLLVAAALRLWDFSSQTAFMDESNYIVTGRLFLDQGRVYANALQWTFGSLLYPLVAGWADLQGGLVMARYVSLGLGLVTVLATVFTTIGLFKPYPHTRVQARADFALASRPVLAGLMAGLIVAVLPNAIALSKFATYDALAVACFALGCATFVWARRIVVLTQLKGADQTGQIALLFGFSAVLFFGAFLSKYVVAIFFPGLCLYILVVASLRRVGFWSFVLPLTLACAAYFVLFIDQLSGLLSYGSSYKDLKVDNWPEIYIWQRWDLIVLLLLGYWCLRLTLRQGRSGGSFIGWAGALTLLIFQFWTRPDYDYWKHSIFIVITMAPLAAWLISDWSWWDEPNPAHKAGRLERWWSHFKQKQASHPDLRLIVVAEQGLIGDKSTERPSSHSLFATLAVLLVLGGVFWSHNEANKLLSHWPSFPNSVAEIQNNVQINDRVLVDDSAMVYYLLQRVPVDYITTPFFNNYRGLNGTAAYTQAVQDQQYSLIVADGGVSPMGKEVWKQIRPMLQEGSTYKLLYSQKLDSSGLTEPHNLEIYRLLTPKEQAAAKDKIAVGGVPSNPANGITPAKPGTTAGAGLPAALTGPTAKAGDDPGVKVPAPAVTPAALPTSVPATPSPKRPATAPASATTAAVSTSAPSKPGAVPVVAPPSVYPPNAVFNFDEDDGGWGALPPVGELEPGTGVSLNETYKMDGHNSLKFTPIVDKKYYTAGVKWEEDVKKISLYVFIPLEKGQIDVRMGLYYFDKDWNWNDDGFTTKVTPGRWTKISWELPDSQSIKQFGLKLVGFSGSVYINGVTVE